MGSPPAMAPRAGRPPGPCVRRCLARTRAAEAAPRRMQEAADPGQMPVLSPSPLPVSVSALVLVLTAVPLPVSVSVSVLALVSATVPLCGWCRCQCLLRRSVRRGICRRGGPAAVLRGSVVDLHRRRHHVWARFRLLLDRLRGQASVHSWVVGQPVPSYVRRCNHLRHRLRRGMGREFGRSRSVVRNAHLRRGVSKRG